MSPSSHQINGVRPLPLRIDKGSYAIHKCSSSAAIAAGATAAHPRQRRPPVIIYAHSPKIIHTEPRYFKALVQKLTGCPRSTDDDPASASIAPPPPPPPSSNAATKRKDDEDDDEDDDSSSSCGGPAAVSDVSSSSSEICSDVPPVAFEQQLPLPNSFSPGIPPFTPNSYDFFSASRLSFSPSLSDVAGGGLSPSVFEALRTLLEEEIV